MSFLQNPTYKLHFSVLLLLTFSMVAAKGCLGDAENSLVLNFISAGREWHSEGLDEKLGQDVKRAWLSFWFLIDSLDVHSPWACPLKGGVDKFQFAPS